MFTKPVKLGGSKTFQQLHPRCKRHASKAVLEMAKDQGYEVQNVED